MAYTVEQVTANITAIEAALGRSTLTVEYADRRVTYRTVDELLKIIAYWRSILASLVAGTGRSKQSLGVASKGFFA